GAYSRWGWHHPGPLLYYLLAPLTWVFGHSGALAGVVLINFACAAAAVEATRRRLGHAAAAMVVAITVVLAWALGPDLLMNPWNPRVALIPLFACGVFAWLLAGGWSKALPMVIALGSFVVQAHVGFAAVVVAIVAVAVALWLGVERLSRQVPSREVPSRQVPSRQVPSRQVPSRQIPSRQVPSRQVMVTSAVVMLVCWFGPLVETVVHWPGNLVEIAKYFVRSDEPALGWGDAWRIFSTEVGLPGAWVRRSMLTLPLSADSPLPALIVLGAV
ncbi:MAG TPA: hypothetical protein PLV68_15355, partial [Ilumatobacteraceae bacterium]|nr:hypothetical protein [Ilumatobacteraceae bacterium]